MKEKITWHIEEMFISDLVPYHKNPRTLTKDQERHLRASLDRFGLIDRPCINLDKKIIGGHQRINVLRKDTKKIEVFVPSRMLDDKEVEELNIRLNANTGSFDNDILANEFELDDLVCWGVEGLKSFLSYELSNPLDKEEEKDSEESRCPECNQKIKKKRENHSAKND